MTIGRIDAQQLGAQSKAALIYAQARAELSSRLWQAALGGTSDADGDGQHDGDHPDLGFETLVALLANDAAQAQPPAPRDAPPPPMLRPAVVHREAHPESYERPILGEGRAEGGGRAAGGLGANAPYAGVLNAAAERTGIPAPALAAIVHAEAAKGSDGRWLAYSRNPRSSAAGLGQFLSGTWIGEAERGGTWLNGIAASRGWLDGRGRVSSEARSELLALRYDGGTAINATADYAKANLGQLRAAGVTIGGSIESVAQSAYVSHHLGLGDAIRFMSGGLDPARARTLLRAQVGSAAADERIAEAGGATRAHRDWLLGFVSRNIQPARFAQSLATAAIPSADGAAKL